MAKKRNPTSEKEINQKLQKVKLQLDQLQQMKKILIAEGIKPDEDDKKKESKYIQQILGLEKDLKRMGLGAKSKSSSPAAKRPAFRP